MKDEKNNVKLPLSLLQPLHPPPFHPIHYRSLLRKIHPFPPPLPSSPFPPFSSPAHPEVRIGLGASQESADLVEVRGGGGPGDVVRLLVQVGDEGQDGGVREPPRAGQVEGVVQQRGAVRGTQGLGGDTAGQGFRRGV